MSVFSASPRCVVEIYPYEGGQYSIVGGDILQCKVTKPVMGGSGGFIITLAPNGPGSGAAAGPDWAAVLTPMSLVIIGLQRYQYSQIVLVGVVTNVSESQDWSQATSSGAVTRVIQVSGQDFSYFFDSFNWSVMSFQAITGAPAAAAGITGNAEAIPAAIGQGLLGGTSSQDSNPAVIGQKWYSTLMAGSGGILAKTVMPYQNGTVSFNDVVSTIFERFPKVYIPFYDNFLVSQGSWTAKFRSIFPWPWYEFFVVTAPAGFYGLASNTAKTFSLAGMPGAAPVSPTLVARINPLPVLTATSKGISQPFTLNDVDATVWNALQIYQLDNHGFISSSVAYSAEQVRNMYQINPLTSRALYGGDNTNTNVYFYTAAGATDVSSIHRFGYRPEITSTEWMADPTGASGANQELDVPQTTATLLCRTISQYEPSHLMASAAVTIPLRPDILPGTKFTYSPFRGQEPWTFYVDAVEHDYAFGGPSVTSLTLSRGFPNSIYADMSKGGVFYAALTGLAQRREGQFEIRKATENDVGLTIFSAQPNQLAALLGSIAQAYVTPQMQ